MKTLKQNNYKWLLDAGHFGWENRKRHRINSQEIMTRLAGMMERGRIDFSRIFNPDRAMPLKNRLARVNALHVEPERCIYLSLQINNTVDSQPDLGCVNMVSGCGRAGVRISTMLGEIFGPGVGSRSQILDVLDRDVAIREDIRQVLQAKYPVILITMFLPGGARVAIRKHVRRKIAAGLYRFIRATEKQIPL